MTLVEVDGGSDVRVHASTLDALINPQTS
jgi:hypothetical protein